MRSRNYVSITLLLALLCLGSSCAGVRSIAVWQDIHDEDNRPSLNSYPDKPGTERIDVARRKEKGSLSNAGGNYEHIAACEELARLFLKENSIYRARAWVNRCLRLRQMAADSNEQITRELMLAATLAYLSGDTSAADKFSLRAVSAQENYEYQNCNLSVPSHLQRAAILRSKGKFSDAVKMDNYALTLLNNKKYSQYKRVTSNDLAASLEGLKQFDAAARVFVTSGKEEDDWELEGRNELSRLLIAEGKFEEALKLIGPLIINASQSPSVLAPLTYRKAVALRGAKKDQESRQAMKETVARYIQAYGIGAHYVFEPLRSLATSPAPAEKAETGKKNSTADDTGEELYELAREHVFSGRMAQAIPQIEKAYQMSKKRWGASHPYTADILTLRGIANEARGQSVAALADYNEAMLITEKYFGKDDVDLIPLLQLIAYSELNSKPKEAITHCSRALAITKKTYPKPPASVAPIYDLRGDACVKSALNTQAVMEYECARQLFLREYAPSWTDINRLQRKMESTPLTESTAALSKNLPSASADGHLFDFQQVSDRRERDNWKYKGELSTTSNVSLKRGMFQPPPDVVPTFPTDVQFPLGIEYLELSGARKAVLNAWLSAPWPASSIKRVSLSGAEVDDSVIDKCLKLNDLIDIDLSDVALTQKTMAALGKGKSITTLNLSGQTLSAADITALAQLPNLKKLTISSGQVPGAELAKLTHLESLTASSSNLTDAHVAAISKLPSLSYLDVSSTSIGDRSVDLLSQMPRLKKIVLGGAKFSAQGKRRLFDQGSKRSLTEMQG